MVGLVGAGLGALKFASGTLGGRLAEEGLFGALGHARSMLNDRTHGNNLISYTQAARMEPILLLDKRAAHIPFVQDVAHTMVNLYTAYLLQAVALDNTLEGVKVMQRLDKFNPDRGLINATRLAIGVEAYRYGLPWPGEQVGLEAYGLEALNPRMAPMDPADLRDYEERKRQEAEISAKVKTEIDDKYNSAQVREQRAREDARIRQEIEDERRKRDSAGDWQRSMREGELRRKVEKAFAAQDADTRRQRAFDDARLREEIDKVFNSYDKRQLDAREQAKLRQEIEQEFNGFNSRLERAREDAHIAKTIKDEYGSKDPASVEYKDMTKLVTEATNLAVGKLIEVTVSENGRSATIPLSIRLRVLLDDPQVLTETLAVGGYDGTFKTRWRQWRAGEIRFLADGFFALDRIKAHRQAAMRDSSGYYAAVHKRAASNAMAALLTGKVSVGTASSIIVLSEQTKLELERKLTHKLSDYRTREKMFENTMAMLMAVLDPDWETVTFYHRGIEMATVLSAKDLKTSSKGSGPDINDLLKLFLEGKAPGRL